MLKVVGTDILNAKVINGKVKPDGVCCMAEQAWGVGLFEVAMFAKLFLEKFVGKDTSLGKAIHAFADFDVDVVLVKLLLQLIMVNDVRGE